MDKVAVVMGGAFYVWAFVKMVKYQVKQDLAHAKAVRHG